MKRTVKQIAPDTIIVNGKNVKETWIGKRGHWTMVERIITNGNSVETWTRGNRGHWTRTAKSIK